MWMPIQGVPSAPFLSREPVSSTTADSANHRGGGLPVSILPTTGCIVHSQKQSAQWAVYITAQMVPCWFGSWLKCIFWPVLRLLTQAMFPFTGLDVTWASCITTVDLGAIKSSEQKISWVSYIWTPESSLNLISPLTWISTEADWDDDIQWSELFLLRVLADRQWQKFNPPPRSGWQMGTCRC